MARRGASAGPRLSGSDRLWDAELTYSAFDEFDFPRHRITGGRGRSDGAARRDGESSDEGQPGDEHVEAVDARPVPRRRSGPPVPAPEPPPSPLSRSEPSPSARASGQGVPKRDVPKRNRRVASGQNGGASRGGNGAAVSGRNGDGVPARNGAGVPGRRTVTIRGYGTERQLPWEAGQSRRRTSEPRHYRAGFKADRAAMWAVLLGIMLVVVAAASSHAAVFHRASIARASTHAAAHRHAVPAVPSRRTAR